MIEVNIELRERPKFLACGQPWGGRDDLSVVRASQGRAVINQTGGCFPYARGRAAARPYQPMMRMRMLNMNATSVPSGRLFFATVTRHSVPG